MNTELICIYILKVFLDLIIFLLYIYIYIHITDPQQWPGWDCP